jgi:hypothetical protein
VITEGCASSSRPTVSFTTSIASPEAFHPKNATGFNAKSDARPCLWPAISWKDLRQSEREYLHFLNLATGSSAEVEYLVPLAVRLGLVTQV